MSDGAITYDEHGQLHTTVETSRGPATILVARGADLTITRRVPQEKFRDRMQFQFRFRRRSFQREINSAYYLDRAWLVSGKATWGDDLKKTADRERIRQEVGGIVMNWIASHEHAIELGRVYTLRARAWHLAESAVDQLDNARSDIERSERITADVVNQGYST
jgi:hypothetical protein